MTFVTCHSSDRVQRSGGVYVRIYFCGRLKMNISMSMKLHTA